MFVVQRGWRGEDAVVEVLELGVVLRWVGFAAALDVCQNCQSYIEW